MNKRVKKELRFSGLIFIGCTPLLIYLDKVMGVVLIRDYGFWGVAGFFVCVVFYAQMSAIAHKDK